MTEKTINVTRLETFDAERVLEILGINKTQSLEDLPTLMFGNLPADDEDVEAIYRTFIQVRLRGWNRPNSHAGEKTRVHPSDYISSQALAATQDVMSAIMRKYVAPQELEAHVLMSEIAVLSTPNQFKAGIDTPEARAKLRQCLDHAIVANAAAGLPIPNSHSDYKLMVPLLRESFATWINNEWTFPEPFEDYPMARIAEHARSIMTGWSLDEDAEICQFAVEAFHALGYEADPDIVDFLERSFNAALNTQVVGADSNVFQRLLRDGFTTNTILTLACLIDAIRTGHEDTLYDEEQAVTSLMEAATFIDGRPYRPAGAGVAFEIPSRAICPTISKRNRRNASREFLTDHVELAIVAAIIADKRLEVPILALASYLKPLILQVENSVLKQIDTPEPHTLGSAPLYDICLEEAYSLMENIWPKPQDQAA